MDGKELLIELEKKGEAVKTIKKEMRDMVVSFVKESPLQVGDIVKMGNEEVMVAAVGIETSYKGEVSVGPSKIFQKKKDGTFSKMDVYPRGGGVEKDGVFYKSMYHSVLVLDSNGEVGVSGEIICVGGVRV